MTSLEQVILNGSSSAALVAQRVRTFLSLQLGDEDSQLPVCGVVTRKMYNTLSAAISTELKSHHFPSLSDLVKCLSLIIRGSSSIHSLLTFGLGRRMVEWLTGLCSMTCTGSMGWRQACTAMATMIEEVLEVCGDKSQLLLLTTSLLEWVCVPDLPVDARLPSSRCVANLLEVMESGQKIKLFSKHSSLFDRLMDGLSSAGDFDLQATMVECCVSVLGDSSGRSDRAHQWFSDHTLITAFTNIHESTFEMDCREFLTRLNSKACQDRTVHSFLCKKVILGATELHPPRDMGLHGFWLDINSASLSLSLNVEDPSPPSPPRGLGGCELWENVSISDKGLQSWNITTERGDVVLLLSLTDPSHSLLPSLHPSHHHTVTITLPPSHNPMLAMERLFKAKQATPTDACTSLATQSGLPPLPTLSMKSSVAITPLRIRQTQGQNSATYSLALSEHAPGKQSATGRSSSASSLKHISPIDVPPDTPIQGGHVNSQSSATPTNHPIPTPLPHTSTPKPTVSRLHTTPALATGNNRPALQFSSEGVSKRSIAISSIRITSQSADNDATSTRLRPALHRSRVTRATSVAKNTAVTTSKQPQGHTKTPLQDLTVKPPQDHATRPPQDHTSKPPQDHTSGPPQDDTSKPPQDHTSKLLQDDTSGPPHDYTSRPPQDHTGKPPQDHTSGTPQNHGSGPPHDDTSKPPQDYTNKLLQGRTSGPPQDYTSRPPQHHTDKPAHGESVTSCVPISSEAASVMKPGTVCCGVVRGDGGNKSVESGRTRAHMTGASGGSTSTGRKVVTSTSKSDGGSEMKKSEQKTGHHKKLKAASAKTGRITVDGVTDRARRKQYVHGNVSVAASTETSVTIERSSSTSTASKCDLSEGGQKSLKIKKKSLKTEKRKGGDEVKRGGCEVGSESVRPESEDRLVSAARIRVKEGLPLSTMAGNTVMTAAHTGSGNKCVSGVAAASPEESVLELGGGGGLEHGPRQSAIEEGEGGLQDSGTSPNHGYGTVTDGDSGVPWVDSGQKKKPHPPVDDGHRSKRAVISKPELRDVTNTASACTRTSLRSSRDGTRRDVAGRPRVGRATQRVFILSHAPMTGGGAAVKGRGKTKSGGGGKTVGDTSHQDLVRAFDFRDSPVVRKTPPSSAPHSIPSSLPPSLPSTSPSPTAIPDSIPSQSQFRSGPVTWVPSRSAVLHSTPDSDHDSDHTWNGDTTDTQHKSVHKKSSALNTRHNPAASAFCGGDGPGNATPDAINLQPSTTATLHTVDKDGADDGNAVNEGMLSKPKAKSSAKNASKKPPSAVSTCNSTGRGDKATSLLALSTVGDDEDNISGEDTTKFQNTATDKSKTMATEAGVKRSRGRPRKAANLKLKESGSRDDTSHSRSKTLLTTSHSVNIKGSGSSKDTSCSRSLLTTSRSMKNTKKSRCTLTGQQRGRKKGTASVAHGITSSRDCTETGKKKCVKKGLPRTTTDSARGSGGGCELALGSCGPVLSGGSDQTSAEEGRSEKGWGGEGRGVKRGGELNKTSTTASDRDRDSKLKSLDEHSCKDVNRGESGRDGVKGGGKEESKERKGLQSPTVSTLTSSPQLHRRESEIHQSVYVESPTGPSSCSSSTAYSPSPQRVKKKRPPSPHTAAHEPLSGGQGGGRTSTPPLSMGCGVGDRGRRRGTGKMEEGPVREKRELVVAKAPLTCTKRPRVSSGYHSLSDSPTPVSTSHSQQGSEIIQETKRPVPPSPASVHSSNVGPDLDLTSNFEKICHNLVARAMENCTVSHTSRKPDINCVDVTSPPHLLTASPPSHSSPITLTRLTRQLVTGGGERERGKTGSATTSRKTTNKPLSAVAQKTAVIGRPAGATTSKQKKTVVTKRGVKRSPLTTSFAPTPQPMTPGGEGLPQDMDISIHSGPGEFPSLMTSLLNHSNSRKRRRIACEEEEREGDGEGERERGERSSTMSSPVVKHCTVAMEVNIEKAAKKPRQDQGGASSSGVMGSPLDRVWREHEEERKGILCSHNDKVTACLVSMEAALDHSWDRNRRVLKSLSETLAIRTDEITTTVMRLEKLRSVLSLFQTKVSDMEQKQDHQRGMAQHSLKKEMIALQKKMMQQAHNAEVLKMRQALQAMLMKM